jgi:bacteriocin biosynthesis cyclodehydratase domain-containing protein
MLGVSEGLDFVLLSDDELLVQFGTRSQPSELLRDSDLTGIIGKVIGRLLEGPASLSDVLSEVQPEGRSEAQLLIDDLLHRGLLTDLRCSPVEQYLRYTFTGETQLADRTVSLIGAGPLGSRLAYTLLQHGIQKLTLLDDRKADRHWYKYLPRGGQQPSNHESPAQIVLRDRLLSDGYTSVECLGAELDSAELEAAVGISDFTVVALEQPNLRIDHLVNRFCIRHRKPWLVATVDGNRGLVGPLFYPTHTACYNDYRTLARAAIPSPLIARKHRQHMLRRGTGSFFTGLPSYAEIVAGHASLASIHFLSRGTSFALGRVMVIDFDRMLIDLEDVLKLPRCPVCSTRKHSYRPAFSPVS